MTYISIYTHDVRWLAADSIGDIQFEGVLPG